MTDLIGIRLLFSLSLSLNHHHYRCRSCQSRLSVFAFGPLLLFFVFLFPGESEGGVFFPASFGKCVKVKVRARVSLINSTRGFATGLRLLGERWGWGIWWSSCSLWRWLRRLCFTLTASPLLRPLPVSSPPPSTQFSLKFSLFLLRLFPLPFFFFFICFLSPIFLDSNFCS